MPRLGLCAALLMAVLSIDGYCQEAPARKPDGNEGGRPSDAQIAKWRARRPADEVAAKPTPGAATADAPNADSIRGGGRPGGRVMTAKHGSNVLWLSDSPPSRGNGKSRWGGMGGMGGMAMGGGARRGPPVKRLWLRAGIDPQKSGFARDDAKAETEILLVTPQGKPEGEPLSAAEHHKLSFEMPVQGYYRLYLTKRKLKDDTLAVSVAKAEVAYFSHGGDEEERNEAATAPRALDSAPIEIVREKKPDEKMFFRLTSGDEQVFIVLRKGVPVANARVRFVSHAGWVKEAVSDDQGRVSFQIVRDYFPAWNEFEKRFKAAYLVIAETDAVESGRFNDQPYRSVRYQATLSGSYYPSPSDYRSYAWGLGIGFAFLIFCGTAIYLYRRRRVKPFAEVRFDEKQ